MARLLCVVSLVLCAVAVSAAPHKRVHSVLAPAASLEHETGLEESAAAFGVSFLTDEDLIAAHEAAVAAAMEEVEHHNHAPGRPMAPPAPGAQAMADPALSRAKAAGFTPVAPHPAVSGSESLSGLQFKMHSQAELESFLESAKKSGVQVAGEAEALAAIKAKGLFNTKYLDARQQLEAGRRSAMLGQVKESCKAALDQLQIQISLTASMPPDVTIGLTCANLRVCGVCLYQAVAALLLPGYGSFSAVGKDTFAEAECEPQLVTWCNAVVHQWLCDMDAMEALSNEGDGEREVQKDRLHSTSFCDTAFHGSEGTLAKCREFTRFLRPIRPDMMRRMRCNLNTGASVHLRRFGAIGRGIVSKLSVIPGLRGAALGAVDAQHSRWAVESTFACPRSAHERVQEVCSYFMPMLGIPALKQCALDDKDEKVKDPLPTSTEKPPPTGFDCIDKGMEKLYGDDHYRFGDQGSKAPEGCKDGIWKAFAKMQPAQAQGVPSEELKAVTAKSVGALATDKLPICKAQALVCAAVAKATAMNRVWMTQGEKGGNWFFTQKISRETMCRSLDPVSRALKHRCKRFAKTQKEVIPYLLLDMGCTVKNKKKDDESMSYDFLTCLGQDTTETDAHLREALKSCVNNRFSLSLPVLSTCSDADLGLVPNQDFDTLLGDYLTLLGGIGTKRITESTLFYRVLSSGNSQWKMTNIQQATAKAVKSGTTNPSLCQFVVDQEMRDNNSPCGMVSSTEKDKCEAARKAVHTTVAPGAHYLSNAIIPFITQQSTSYKWKVEKFSFASAKYSVCNKVGVTVDTKYSFTAPDITAAPAECQLCMDSIAAMVTQAYSSPDRSSETDLMVKYMTGVRLKYAFGASLYRLAGKRWNTNKSTKDSYAAVNAWLDDAVKGLAADDPGATAVIRNIFETLRTQPPASVTHVPPAFDATDVLGYKTEIDAIDALAAKALTLLKLTKPWVQRPASTARPKFWCQVVLPQCEGWLP